MVLEDVMMGLHDSFEARFFACQRALLDRDFERAAAELTAYRVALLGHMEDEEGEVLPRYEALGGDESDAPVRLFLGEHRNMRKFVDDFQVRIEGLRARPDDHDLLELFDRQATYKNLVLHHDLRERNVLYPFLAARLGAAEQQRVVDGLRTRPQ